MTPDQIIALVNESVNTANKQGGWTAGLTALSVIVCFTALVILVKHWINKSEARELGLTNRLQSLEDFNRKELVGLVKSNGILMSRLISLLDTRICLLSHEARGAARVVEEKRRQARRKPGDEPDIAEIGDVGPSG